MSTKIKILFFFILMALSAWGFYTAYSYIFNETYPEVFIEGLESGCAYANQMHCSVQGSDSYSVADVTIWLDDKMLVDGHPIHKQNFEYTFPVATKSLTDGEHTMKVVVSDGSYARHQTSRTIPFYIDNVPLQTAFINPEKSYKVFQGRTLHIQFQTNKLLKNATVTALSQEGVCVPETKNAKIYDCYIPISSDTQASEYVLTIKATDAVGNVSTLEKTFQVVMYPFKKQRLNISSQAYQEQRNRGLAEQQLEEAIQHITSQSTQEKLWHGAFFVPCDMQGTSTEYGTLRTTQQRGKYRHDALDLLATPKSVIWACQDGNIALKNRYEHSGNTVIIDHGAGVLSLYYHLDEHADIEVGQSIKQGKPIGTLGKTGYASGYHLHWELRIKNVAVDPMEWAKPGF